MATVYSARCPCLENVVVGKTICASKYGYLGKKTDSEVGIRLVIYNHLMNSPYHLLSEKEAKEWSTLAEIQTAEYTEEEWQEWQQQQPQAQKNTSASKKRGSAELDELKATVTELKRHVGVEPHIARPSSSASSVSATPRCMELNLFEAKDVPMVALRRTELLTICDSVNRASKAAKQAALVCATAASGFDAEAKALDDALVNIQRRLF